VAGLIAGLKLRSLGNAVRRSRRARVAFILSTTMAAVVAVSVFASLAALRGRAGAVDEVTAVFTMFAFAWLVLPIFAFGLDATLDPATLALYPLRARPLAVGLLAASAAGVWPLANVLGLLGVTAGLAGGVPGLLTAVAAVLLQVLFCITLARFVTTGLARLLRSRRGKDLAAFLLLPVFALYQVITQVVPRMAVEGRLRPVSFAGLDRWLRWLPPGLAAHAVQYASAGRTGTALGCLLLLAAVTAVLGCLWIGILRRALVTVDTTTQSSAVHQGALPFARFGLRGTVAARFWIYQRREPSSLIYWGIVGVVMIASSVSSLLTPSYRGALLSSAGIGAALLAIFHSNSAGMTGPAFVFEAMALTGRRALRCYFSGQNLALCIIAVPLLSAISFGLAAVAGHPAAGFAAVAVDFAGIGASMALSNVFAARLPYPTEKREGSPVRGAAEGHAAHALWATLGSLLGTALAISPVAAAEVLTSHAPAAVCIPVLLACAAGYGLALAWAGVRIAARVAERKLPELCQIALHSMA
jgi:ABC-2 type transport system permease protein